VNRKNSGIALGLALGFQAPAFAQNAQPSPSDPSQAAVSVEASKGARRFVIADFAQYTPVSALDMVRRIPGFSIDVGDGRRGFGDNAGNVLIDGDRPSTKSDGIESLLGRIPANQVDYIELTESAGGDSEARGKAQTINVVRKKSSKISGTYDGAVQIGEKHDVTPYGSGSLSFRKGETVFDLNAGYYDEDVRGAGPEDFFTGQRVFQERRAYQGHGGFSQYSFGSAMKTRRGATKINASAKFQVDRGFDNRTGRITGPLAAPIGTETLTSIAPDSNWSYELGADFEFPLAPKLVTKLVTLWRDNREKDGTRVDTDFVTRPDIGIVAASQAHGNEAILRVQNDWSGVKGHAVQFGSEFAFNRLSAGFDQSRSLAGVVTVFPPSRVVVSEWRIEPFVSDVWSISPQWKLEGGIVFEASQLKVKGDGQAKRSLKFIKPHLVGTWTLSKATSMEFRAERQVAQLDFGEFATSVDVAAGNQVDAGNADLVPEKVISVSALVRHKFMGRGSVQLKAEYQKVSDTQDLVPITIRDAFGVVTARFDGAGNIGKSKRWNVELEITLPLDWVTKPLGIAGIEVKYVGHYHGSRVIDPVTGLARGRSYNPVWHQSWDVRHDIGKTGIAWGGSVTVGAANNSYFLDQWRNTRENPKVYLFIEYKKFKLGTLKLEVSDATSARWWRDRRFYDDTRASGVLTQIIEREKRYDRRFTLSLSGKF
jgi:hypothetical protein